MSKQTYIARYNLIIRKLRSEPFASFKRINDYIAQHAELLQVHDDRLNMAFSLRTFQRDIREISLIYGIDIAYSRKERGYYIYDDAAGSGGFHRMLEAFDLFQALNFAKDLAPYIHMDHGTPQGTEHMHLILGAIRERCAVCFRYTKFHENSATDRYVDPLALKEYRNRWYLLARERGSGELKTFGLDRVSGLQRTGDVYDYPSNYDVNEHFRHSFGIVNPADAPPEETVLSFAAFQGQYVRTLPLHHSQRILVDSGAEFRIALHLRITEDFIMELLSYGEHLTVIAPRSLRHRMQWSLTQALRNYDT